MADTSFHGIDIKTMAGLSDNMMYILGPSQIASIDTTSGVSAILPYEDVHAGFARHIGEQLAKVVRFEAEPKTINYSVAQHTLTMANLCREIDMSSPGIHDQLEQHEARLRARMRLKQEEMMRDILSGTTQKAETRLPYSLDELEADLDRLAEQQYEADKKLIEALIAAGVDVMQGDQPGGRPVVTLPASMNRARQAVVAARANRDRQENHYRDSLAYWGGRLDMQP